MTERGSPKTDQIPARRRTLILEQVRLRGAAAIPDLAEAVGVSMSTIRRDLDAMTQQGMLERTHGGALIRQAPTATFEPENTIAAQTALPQKAAIGREAASRLTPGASVIIDAGSTVLEAVRALIARDIALTVVTNSLAAAHLCGSSRAIRTIVVGGVLRQGSAVLSGEPGIGFLDRLHADLCLLGAHAVTGTLVTESSVEGADIKRAMQAAARRTILLVDSSKFQHPAFCSVCRLEALSEVITDDGISAEALATMREAGVTVTVVAAEEEAG
ncbi:MAG: DeoR/GlpR family DNA-binding transcription regulator [Acetobacteraceae bacterium]